MEVSCSFRSTVGGICGPNPRDRSQKEVVIPVLSCVLDVSGHTKAFSIQDIHSEVELVLARASIFSVPENILELTICPGHRSSLGIGWRRGYLCSRRFRLVDSLLFCEKVQRNNREIKTVNFRLHFKLNKRQSRELLDAIKSGKI